MNKKHKLEITLKNTLKSEQRTVYILFIASIVFLIASLLLEFVGKRWVGYSLQRKIHIDYFVNILLGIAASAFVSYVSVVFAYRHHKNAQIMDIIIRLKRIYFEYVAIFGLIQQGEAGNNFSFEDYYSLSEFRSEANVTEN